MLERTLGTAVTPSGVTDFRPSELRKRLSHPVVLEKGGDCEVLRGEFFPDGCDGPEKGRVRRVALVTFDTFDCRQPLTLQLNKRAVAGPGGELGSVPEPSGNAANECSSRLGFEQTKASWPWVSPRVLSRGGGEHGPARRTRASIRVGGAPEAPGSRACSHRHARRCVARRPPSDP